VHYCFGQLTDTQHHLAIDPAEQPAALVNILLHQGQKNNLRKASFSFDAWTRIEGSIFCNLVFDARLSQPWPFLSFIPAIHTHTL
jgi:hypothetical protein